MGAGGIGGHYLLIDKAFFKEFVCPWYGNTVDVVIDHAATDKCFFKCIADEPQSVSFSDLASAFSLRASYKNSDVDPRL